MGAMKELGTGFRGRRASAREFAGQVDYAVTISGDQHVADLFARLPDAVQNRLLRPMLAGAARQLAEELRSAAPAETGLLKQALGASAVKTYRSVLFVTSGVRRGFRRAVSLGPRSGKWRIRGAKATASADKATVRNPAKYLHLVTGGRTAVEARAGSVLYSAQSGIVFGRRAKEVTGRPFIQQTFASAAPRVATAVCREAALRIEDEAARQGIT